VEPFSEDVAAGVRAGDPDAVGAVYVALADRLLSYLAARVGDRATAEDLLEATFLELLLKGRTIIGGPRAIKVWLFRAATYNALDHHRAVRRRSEELCADLVPYETRAEDPGPEELAISSETAAVVRAALEEVSEEQRQVLLLRYVAGLSAVEAGGGGGRSLQHRGERALGRLLADVDGIDPSTTSAAPASGAASAASEEER
jgi:RNA polymerase sigma-70 factor (ECF subfamily)